MLNHRGDRVRYGRFAEPGERDVGGEQRFRTPLALQDAGDWWRALRAETDRKQGRVLLYVHGYRERFETTTKIGRAPGGESAGQHVKVRVGDVPIQKKNTKDTQRKTR